MPAVPTRVTAVRGSVTACGLFLLLAALGVGTIAPAAEEHKPPEYVALPSGTSQTLVLEGKSFAVRIGVTLAKDAPASVDQLRVRVFEVAFKEGRAAALVKDFDASFQGRDASHGDALIVSVPAASENVRPGSYVLTLHVTSTAPLPKAPAPKPAADAKSPPASAPPKFQQIVLTLQRPAPALTVGPSVLISRVMPVLAATPRVINGKVSFTEESDNADIRDIGLAFDADPPATGEPTAGEVLPVLANAAAGKDTTTRFTVPHGEGIEIPITVRGHFSPGAFKGKVTARSRDLAAPASIAYEVRSRRSFFWIWILAGVGVLVGTVVRVILKKLQEQNNAHIATSEAREAILLARERIEEKSVRDEFDRLRAALDKADAEKIAADIVTAATTATTELKTLQDAFAADRKAFESTLQKFQEMIRSTWDLPLQAQPALHAALASADVMTAYLSRNNLTKARDLLAATLRGSVANAVNVALAWRHGVASYLKSAAEMPAPVDADHHLRLAGAAQSAPVPALTREPHVTVEKADSEFTAASNVHSNQHKNALLPLPEAVEAFEVSARAALEPLVGFDRAPWAALKREQDAFVNGLRQGGADPGANLTELTIQLRNLHRAWLGIVDTLLPKEQQADVQKALKEGGWASAIQLVAQLGEKEEEIELESLDFGAPAAGLESDARRDRHSAEPGRAVQPGSADRIVPFETLERRRRDALRLSNWRAAFMQSAIVGLVFGAVVFGLYYEAWVGTYKEMVTLFMLAFGTDLTAESVITTFKK